MTIEQQKEIRYSRQILAFKEIVEQFRATAPLQRILVLGCGNGLEAGYMSKLLNAEIYGIDIDKEFHPFGWMNANLQNYDGKRLPFPDAFFDAVYSYHVLEHVVDVPGMLAEIRRVVRQHGFVYAGVPNKARLFGYLGMNDKSLYRKIKQNVQDWIKRLKGEWENARGAHAGFGEEELVNMFARHFRLTVSVSCNYYGAKWPKYQAVLSLLSRLSLDKRMMPSVYVLAAD